MRLTFKPLIASQQFLSLIVIFLLGTGFLIYQERVNTQNMARLNEDCLEAGQRIVIKIKDNAFYPDMINAKRCDLLVIVNSNKEDISPAFGEHDRHTYYKGFKQIQIGKDEKQEIQLVTPGTYTMHDDLHGIASATVVIE